MAYGLFERTPFASSAYQETQLSGWSQLSDEDQVKYDAAKAEARDRGIPDVYDEPGYRTDPDTHKTRKRWNLLELNEHEKKWLESNTTESIDRIRSRGANMDREALNLRVMYEYAKTGKEGARSIDQIRKLAWQVRRNRDIATAREVAREYSEALGKPVDWRDAYVPTTVPMLSGESTVTELRQVPATARVVSGPYVMTGSGGMTYRTLPREEAMAMEINEAMKGSGYADPTMLLRAEYLAKRYGLEAVSQTGDVVDRFGDRTGRTKARRTMAYRARSPEEIARAGKTLAGREVPYEQLVSDSVRRIKEHVIEQTGMPDAEALAVARDSVDAGIGYRWALGDSWLDYDTARRTREAAYRRQRAGKLREALALSPMAKALGLYDPVLERSVRWRVR